MAQYRLHANIIGRAAGRSAVSAAAYRSAQRMVDERTGLIHDYTRKQGVTHSEILLPENTPEWMGDRARLWNAVEAASNHKKIQLSREIQLSLPHELTHEQRVELVRRFAHDHWRSRGVIADINIHAPGRGGDDRNHHAHIMLTMRELTGDGFGKQFRKTPAERAQELAHERESWATYQNREFERLGLNVRVDHRSYDDQGIDREPMQHLGPVANDMEKKGKASRVGDENRERQQRNAERAALAQESADLSREIAAEKARLEEHENLNKALLQSRRHFEEIEMDRRHSREQLKLDAELEDRDREWREKLESERQTLQTQLQADGWRKLMRDVMGKTRRDREAFEVNRLNLESIRIRDAEERQALQDKQEAERAALSQSRQQREQERVVEMQQERAAALEQTRTAPEPMKTSTPANDRSAPQWERPHAPEQDNRGKGAQEFNRAAETSPAPSPAKGDHEPDDPGIDELFDRMSRGPRRDRDIDI